MGLEGDIDQISAPSQYRQGQSGASRADEPDPARTERQRPSPLPQTQTGGGPKERRIGV